MDKMEERGVLGKRHREDHSSSSSDMEKRAKREQELAEDSESEVDEAEVERIYQQQKLRRQAQAELEMEKAGEKLTKEELDLIVEKGTNIQVESDFSKPALKKMVQKLESLFQLNQEQRMQHTDEPDKFMESETDLHCHLKSLEAIAAQPETLQDFIAVGAIPVLLMVLEGHQNIEISIDVVSLLDELTDEDGSSGEEGQKQLVKWLYENEVWALFANKNDDDFRLKSISLLQNMIEIDPLQTSNKLMHSDEFVKDLLAGLSTDLPLPIQVVSAELLSLIIASCHNSFRTKFVLTMKGLDKLMAQIWKSTTEITNKDIQQEKLEHLFDSVSALLVDGGEEACQIFKQGQGYEFMFTCIKHNKKIRREAIKVICIGLTAAADINELMSHALHLIEGNACLATIFPLIKQLLLEAKQSPKAVNDACRSLEHCLSVVWSLIYGLQESQGLPLDRLLFKFVEGADFPKVHLLADVFQLAYHDSKLSQYDITQFGEDPEELKWLCDDYQLDLASLAASILGYIGTSKPLLKLLEKTQITQEQFYGHTETMYSQKEVKVVVELHGKRVSQASVQATLIKEILSKL